MNFHSERDDRWEDVPPPESESDYGFSGYSDADPTPPDDQNTSSNRRRLRPVLIAEPIAQSDRKPLIKGLLGIAEFSVVYGAPKCGKSFVALDMAFSIARGVPWFDRTTEPGLVVYVAAEGQRGIDRRIQAYCQHHDVDPADVPLARIVDAPDLRSNIDDAQILIDEINAMARDLDRPINLIIVDTLARALAGGNENGPEDMGALIANIGRLQADTGAHVMLVHHSGKDTQRGLRGHSSLFGAVDAQIKVEKLEASHRLTLEAAKDDPDGWSIGFDLLPVEIAVDDEGDPITSLVVLPSTDDASAKVPALTKLEKRAFTALTNAIAERGQMVIPKRYMTQCNAVSLASWREDLKRASVTSRDNPSTERVQFKRILEGLINKQKIAVWDDHIWSTVTP
ncbi:MAG: helicase RepA family protein [Magnetospiraceae bacterium]